MKKAVLIFISVALLVLSRATPIVRNLHFTDATGLNQGRHIDRTPNTAILNVVYHQIASSPHQGDGEVVWLIRSLNGGANWGSPEVVLWKYNLTDERGRVIDSVYVNSAFPSLAANDPGGGVGGVALLGLIDTINNVPINNPIDHGFLPQLPPTGGGIGVFIIKYPHRWVLWSWFSTNKDSLRYGVPAGDFVRLVRNDTVSHWSAGWAYVRYDNRVPYSLLRMEMLKCYTMNDSLKPETATPYIADIDTASISGHIIRNPSVVMSDTNLIHIAYEKNGEILYSYFDCSTHSPPLKIGDGRNPQISLWGNKVYVTWTQGDTGGIVRRYHFLDDPYTTWHPQYPDTISNSPDDSSDYAEMRGSIDWQEGYDNFLWAITNQSVWDDSRSYISDLSKNCRYPHLNVFPELGDSLIPGPPPWPTAIYYNIWTQGDSPDTNEIIFTSFSPGPPHCQLLSLPDKGIALGLPPDYTIKAGGDPYCLHRTGTILSRGGAVDYDTLFLAYKLPYLRYYMHYPVRIIVYIDTIPGLSRLPAPLYETLSFDGVQDTVIALTPGRPETLWVKLRQELYQHDGQVILTIRGAHKSPAFLKQLDVYEGEILQGGSGGGSQSAGSGRKTEFPLLKIEPTLFRREAAIRYEVTELGPVSLKIYDADGRAVKTIYQGKQKPGSYKLIWDSKADNGQLLPNGIYFIRLETNNGNKTHKAILIR